MSIETILAIAIAALLALIIDSYVGVRGLVAA